MAKDRSASAMTPEELKKYECAKHGGNGNPECAECWTNLHRLLSDMNCHVVTDKVERKAIEP